MTKQLFDALSFPFSGIRLIEASAGTGKTYSLSNLYIRLILGHGAQHNSHFKRALAVDEILILTFTRAATRELKERIYQRIQDTLTFFLSQNATAETTLKTSDNDPFLKHLYLETQDTEDAIHRLRYAAALIDQASIFTLHSFCQRIVQDNSFSLQYNPQANFEIESYNTAQHVLLDMWRDLNSADRPHYASALIHSLWSSFSQFSQFFINFITNHQDTPLLNCVVDVDTLFVELFEVEYYLHVDAFKKRWLEELPAIQDFFQQEAISRSNLYITRIEKITQICNNNFQYFSVSSTKEIELLEWFSTPKIKQQVRKNFSLPDIPQIYTLVDTLLVRQPKHDELKLQQWVLLQLRKRWEEHKQRHQLIFPADVLQQLIKALNSPNNTLVDKLREQFPVAMIDEFQDTDAAQYQIFHRLYNLEVNATSIKHDTALVLIGDPKQAIYQFRGADLFTYINAKRNIPTDQHYHMQNNWRSSEGLVSACNTLFSLHEDPFLSLDIPFIKVHAQAHTLVRKSLCGVSQAGRDEHVDFHIWQALDLAAAQQSPQDNEKKEIEPTLSVGVAKQTLFKYCAKTINQLLNVTTYTVNNRTIQSRDICILVRTRNDAKEIKHLLFEHGIASVFLSKDSVYESVCAEQLGHCLAAILQPQKISRLKTALSSSFYQYTQIELHKHHADYTFWHNLSLQFHAYQQLWRQHGILAMLQHWAIENEVYARLKSLTTGLRWISDFQHLAHLLQVASLEHGTIENTYDFLQEQIALSQRASTTPEDAYILRLENDDSLISISTVHTSKGLEYPIVFYPYACGGSKNTSSIIHRQDEHQQFHQYISFTNANESHEVQIQESLAEDLRLLYVALTRAKYACYIGFANTPGSANSLAFSQTALAHILGLSSNQKLTKGAIQDVLEHLHKKNHHLSYTLVDSNENTLAGAGSAPQKSMQNASIYGLTNSITTSRPLIKPLLPPTVNFAWRISSYSQLAHHKEILTEQQGQDEHWEFKNINHQYSQVSTPVIDNNLALEPADSSKQRFTFPKGARIGQFLHSVLEQLDFANLHLNSSSSKVPQQHYKELEELVVRQLKYFSLDHLNMEYLNCLCLWMIDIANQPLSGANGSYFSLAMLAQTTQRKMKVEMHFYLAIKSLTDTPQVNHLLSKYGYLDAGRKPLSFSKLHGLLTGFIDVVVEHQGQYFIIDYKSNDLGACIEAYEHAKLQEVIFEHHYDLQYIVYTLAIHRLLKLHVKDYDFEKHMGGSFYLFLRGLSLSPENLLVAINSHNSPGVFYDKPPYALIHALDQLFIDQDLNNKQ